MAHMAVDPAAARKADIVAHATVALDGRVNAMRWLQQPHRNLNNRTPLDVLFEGNPEEMQQVDELLSALEYGIHT